MRPFPESPVAGSARSKKLGRRGTGVKNHEIYVTAFGGYLSFSWPNFTLLEVGGGTSAPLPRDPLLATM